MIKRKITANGIEFEIVSPDESFEGKTYGQYLANSWNKLLSDDPDGADGHIYYIRTSPNPEDAPSFRKRIEISSDQAIFLPVRSVAMNTSDADELPEDFPDLETEPKRRAAANQELDKGDSPPKAEQLTIDGQPVVDDLKDFRFQSPEFTLIVDPRSPVKDKLETTYGGKLPTVAAGYCVIIKSLPSRDKPYMIDINARGARGYYTKAVYEVQVIDKK